jgi:hypothetical protein
VGAELAAMGMTRKFRALVCQVLQS